MRKLMLGALALVVAAATAGSITGCGKKQTQAAVDPWNSAPAATQGPVRVGSKPDGENLLLAEIIMQTLKAHGFKVVSMTPTGDTAQARAALLKGGIDIYPEYTGTAVLDFHKKDKVDPSALQTASAMFDAAKAADAPLGLTWLYQASANYAPAIAVNKKMATTDKLATVTDLAAYLKRGGQFKLAGMKSFFADKGAVAAYERVYGFKLTPAQIVEVPDGSSASDQAAIASAQGVNAWIANGTDGALSAPDLLVLADDKGAQPAYQPAPVVRTAALDKWGEIRVWLSPVFVRLDPATLRSLNKQITRDGKDPKVVARAWLQKTGFVK